jgi:hypothetical protein
MASRISGFFSRKSKEATTASRKLGSAIEADVDQVIAEAKRDVKKAAASTTKAVKVTARATAKSATATTKTAVKVAKTTTKKAVSTAKATTKTAVKTVTATANDTAKNVSKTAKTAKAVGKAIVADVKKDINLATKPNATWTVADLKATARKRGIAGYSSLTKPELLTVLGAK